MLRHAQSLFVLGCLQGRLAHLRVRLPRMLQVLPRFPSLLVAPKRAGCPHCASSLAVALDTEPSQARDLHSFGNICEAPPSILMRSIATERAPFFDGWSLLAFRRTCKFDHGYSVVVLDNTLHRGVLRSYNPHPSGPFPECRHRDCAPRPRESLQAIAPHPSR